MTTDIETLAPVHAAYAAFRAREVDALLATMDPEIEWVHPQGLGKYGLGGTKHGHAGVKEFLAHVPTVMGGMRLLPEEYLTEGQRVVVFGHRDIIALSGYTETHPFVHSWILRGGRAVRMEDIFDTVEFLRVIES